MRLSTRVLPRLAVVFLLAAGLSACDQAADNKQAAAPVNASVPASVNLQPEEYAANAANAATGVASAEQSPAPAEAKTMDVQHVYAGVPLQVADITTDSYDDGNAIAVTFSVPLDGSRDFQRFFRVQQLVSGRSQPVVGQWFLSDDARTVYFDQVEPDSSYDVSVDAGLVAINQNSLRQPKTVNVTFSGLEPSISFASSGHFLPLDLHTGIPVTVLNTPEANVAFHRVDPARIRTMIDWKQRGQSEHYYRLDEIRQFSTLVYEGRFTFPAERNKRRQINLPVQDIAELNEPGLYMAVMSRPGMYDNTLAATYFMVTDIGMHIRSQTAQTDIYLHGLKDPAPVADAEVQVIGDNNQIRYTGKTGADGHLTINRSLQWGSLLVARKGDSVSVVSMNAPALDLSDFNIEKRPYQKTELFIYAPRDIYRPGETAQFSALLRDDDGRTFSRTPLKARIVRPDGQQVKDLNWQPQDASYYQYSFAIPQDAQTGTWRLEVDNLSTSRSVYEFKVEDFMPERLKLTFNAGSSAAQFFSPADTVTIPVLGEYLYGAPAAGNRFDAAVRVAQLAHPFEQWPDYFFGNAADTDQVQQFDENGMVLDNDGNLLLEFDSRWAAARTTLALNLTGSLYESGGRPVVRRHSVRILPASELVGIRPVFTERAPANSLAEFELLRTNAQGEKLAANNLSVRLINQNRRYHWRYDSGRGWWTETTEREVTVLTLPASIKAGETGKIALPVAWGDYRIEVEDKATGLIASMEFKAGERWYWNWSEAGDDEQGARPDKVTLALDKAAYRAGDTAVLSIVPPAAGETLLLVESDHVLWSERVHVPAAGAQVRIPVDKDWNRHDIYITALHLQPADQQARVTPTRALGLLHLPLSREDRRLTITSDAPAKWIPNQKVVTELRIADAGGKAVNKAFVSLSAVDVGILSLTDFKTPDPHQWFFSPRRYQADMRDMYNRLITLNSNRLASQRFGGDAELSRGGKQARAEVEIVSLFSGVVSVTDGVARIPLDLPDFNGRLRLMAVAFDEGRFGSMEQEVTLAAPVVTQLSMPRFVAVGDETSVALDVTNLSGEEQALNVALQFKGPVSVLGDTPLTQALTLADGRKQTLLVPLRAEYPQGQIEIAMTLTTAGGYTLNHSWKLNSRDANPAITRRKDQVLQPGESLTLSGSELGEWVPASLEALLAVNNRVDLNARNHLRHLLHYPYGCLEQSVSSTYPWVYATPQQLQSLGIQSEVTISREQALEQGMQRIVTRQMESGGYGLWSNHDEDEQHWLTAYATDFLTDAQDEGVSVDASVLRRSLNRLSEYVRGRANFSERWSERPGAYRQTYQAYAAYVLARHKRASLSDIRTLATQLDADVPALALLHLSLAARLQGDQALADELMLKHKARKRDGQFYLGDYGSELRDTAQAVRLLLQYQVEQSYALELARTISAMVKARYWMSTQERNALFMAAVRLDNLQNTDWMGEWALGSDRHELKQDTGFSRVLRGEALTQGLSFTNRGTDPLYATMLYQGHSRKAPPEETQGVSIARHYYTTQGEVIVPDDGALRMKVGELMLVELAVKADKRRRPDLLVADLLPAGLELENQNLSASIKLDEVVIDGRPVSEWRRENRIFHEEYRDDRFAAAIDAYSWSETRLYYLVRAVTPGNYQVPVPLVEDMYDPEIRGVGTTPDILTVIQP
ncbi:alpha-2-macroglobulin family protein [Thalassolituus sp. LLYu03]|uniref:alpha-2-macroglobulin family protein n=1 Tax=Thalassolituus sp. LLYu03 TaxID=3421656 RepID=UPI003D2D5C80